MSIQQTTERWPKPGASSRLACTQAAVVKIIPEAINHRKRLFDCHMTHVSIGVDYNSANWHVATHVARLTRCVGTIMELQNTSDAT